MASNQSKTEYLLNQGRYRECLSIYIRRFREGNKSEDLAYIAGCLYKLKRSRLAKQFAARAIDISVSGCPQATLVLANIEFDCKNNLSSWRLYRSLEVSELWEHGRNGLAMICARKNRLTLAERILKDISKTAPSSTLCHRSLTQLYLEHERLKDAWQHVSRWVDLSPESIEAWETAYACAMRLKETSTAKLIAQKLTKLCPSQPKYYEWEGLAIHELGEDEDAITNAFSSAYNLIPNNIAYYINSTTAYDRIAPNGGYAQVISRRLRSCAENLTEKCSQEASIIANGKNPLLNSAFFAAYSALNLKTVYQPYYQALALGFENLISQSLQRSQELLECYNEYFAVIDKYRVEESNKDIRKRVRMGFISKNFFDHSNTQAFSGIIKYLDRSRFEVILIHKYPTRPDWIQSWLNSLADEVVYLSDSTGDSHATLCRLEIDILFYTDLGMDAWDFILPVMRPCKLQATGWGLPHTSGLSAIDYYFSSSLLESPQAQDEYTEKLVLLDGLPCCFLRETLTYHKVTREYFMLPSNHLVIGCVQSLPKVHPDLDLIIEAISKQLPDAYFVFMYDREESSTARFRDRLLKRAPTASQKTLFLDRCLSKDFLSLCDCFDFMLDTPYYGGGITSYMSMYVGTPIVCFEGERLRASTTAAIYKILEIRDAPICASIHDYITTAVALGNDFNLRLQIKKDTVAAAGKLYDRKDYIKSFEDFCIEALAKT